jgi:menaquinol-cytochrome c reductase iron-sulfur subunit
MSNSNRHDNAQPDHKPVTRREMTRRQFLSYTLGGAGAFLVGGTIIPMIRFAVDPLLQKAEAGEYVKVVEESKITSEPQEFRFKVHQIDGWYESDPEFIAWIARDDNNEIFALSPVCKHLGCTVNWNSEAKYPNQYFCPCHGAHYTKDGKNLAVAPRPLDEYDVKLENGFVYLGAIKPNSRV